MTIVYIVGHLLEANQSIMHGTWLLPQVFSTGTRIPHGVCAVLTLILVQPSSGGDDPRRGIFHQHTCGARTLYR